MQLSDRPIDERTHRLPQALRNLALVCGCLLSPTPSHALQPLAQFIEAAEKSHPEQLEASAMGEQRKAEEKASTWHLLPSLSINGSYTRNQYERYFVFPGDGTTAPERLPLMPYNQVDGNITLSVPLLNVAAWEQKDASRAQSTLATASQDAVRQDVRGRVVRAYYQLLGSAAVRKAAAQNVELSKDNARIVQERRNNGAATELDVQRALSEVARSQQDLASSQLAETIAQRTLSSLTSIEPEQVLHFPKDDLHAESALEHWTRSAQASPALLASQAAREAAQSQADVAQAAWYPTITGTAQERFTNATALVGHEAYYLFQVSVGWRFDGANLHTPDAQKAAVKAAQARATQSELATNDAVFQAWHQVKTGIEKAGFARTQDAAAEQALLIAKEQYRAGATTQLEVLSAQQAAFGAEVARIQADTDLGYARAALRVLTAQALTPEHRPTH